MTDKLKYAKAIFNLTQLGYDPANALKMAERWAVCQAHYIGLAFGHRPIPKSEGCWPSLTPDGYGRLCLAPHHGFYPILYRELASTSPSNKVFAIVGEQSADHERELARIATVHKFTIEFLRPSIRLPRDARDALKTGSHIVLLADVPWAHNEQSHDTEYAAAGGIFLGRSTLPRLIQLIDPEPVICHVSDLEQRFLVHQHPFRSLPLFFERVGELLLAAPWQYERLHRLHEIFRPDQQRTYAITFAMKGVRIFLDMAIQKAYRISGNSPFNSLKGEASIAPPDLHNWTEKKILREFDAIICI